LRIQTGQTVGSLNIPTDRGPNFMPLFVVLDKCEQVFGGVKVTRPVRLLRHGFLPVRRATLIPRSQPSAGELDTAA
jgi:hypothetical protein